MSKSLDPVTSVGGHFGCLDSRILFISDDVANVTMPHCVAFKCSNDAKKKDPNISVHVEPSENCPEVRKEWIYAIGQPIENVPKKPHLCSCHFNSSCFDLSHNLWLQLWGGSRTETKTQRGRCANYFPASSAKEFRKTSLL